MEPTQICTYLISLLLIFLITDVAEFIIWEGGCKQDIIGLVPMKLNFPIFSLPLQSTRIVQNLLLMVG